MCQIIAIELKILKIEIYIFGGKIIKEETIDGFLNLKIFL